MIARNHFWAISELGSTDYLMKSMMFEIGVFKAIFMALITLYCIVLYWTKKALSAETLSNRIEQSGGDIIKSDGQK